MNFGICRLVSAMALVTAGTVVMAPTLGGATLSGVATQSSVADKLETVEVFTARGSREVQSVGKDLSRRLSTEVRSLRGSHQAELEQVRDNLVEYARKSRRGKASVEASLVVIEALLAPTQQEYRTAMDRLPVTVQRMTSRDVSGRLIASTEYSYRGVVRARRSIALPVLAAQAAGAAELQPTTHAHAAGSDGGPSASESVMPKVIDCEYTDDENNYWSGTCATQQEIDDAYATAIALDSDASGAAEEASVDIDYCQTVLNQCWASHQDGSAVGGPSAETCVEEDCTARSVAFATATLNYGWRAWKLWNVINAAAPPAGALGDAVILTLVGLGGVVATGILLHDCVWAE